MSENEVLATFFDHKDFPVTWDSEEEKELHWFYDDLHCPNPLSPMYASIGWWGPTCEYMYRRFGAPFGKTWLGKVVNGYLYTAVVPPAPEEAGQIAPYYGMVMSTYAKNFITWWRNRYLPEIKRNFDYLDNFPTETATLPELMIYLEDALDIHERHLRIHWILNLAQFQASMDFNAAVGEVIGEVDPALVGRILISIEDRNWDAIKELWELKQEVKANPDLQRLFDQNDTASEIVPALERDPAGATFMEKVDAYAKEYGIKSMYCHEWINKQWVEDVTPIVETLKSYVVTDFDYPSMHQFARDDQTVAIEGLRALVPETAPEEERERFESALDLVLRMMPLTPDHHFYLDQGTNGRIRLVFLALGRHLVETGLLRDPEDIFYLTYDQLRYYVGNPKTDANPGGFDGMSVVKKARQEREDAWKVRPVDWIGTVSNWSLYQEPYKTLWGYPERFLNAEQKANDPIDCVTGLAAAAGLAEGRARVVIGPEEFDQVKKGEIMVCIMTNPAWVVVFTKVAAIVSDSGGVLSHPAVVAREFGIPAVTGTTNATKRVRTGDLIRVNGSTGIVEIVERATVHAVGDGHGR
jgi:phosphohistidine swiveling domain-containing protein